MALLDLWLFASTVLKTSAFAIQKSTTQLMIISNLRVSEKRAHFDQNQLIEQTEENLHGAFHHLSKLCLFLDMHMEIKSTSDMLCLRY